MSMTALNKTLQTVIKLTHYEAINQSINQLINTLNNKLSADIAAKGKPTRHVLVSTNLSEQLLVQQQSVNNININTSDVVSYSIQTLYDI